MTPRSRSRSLALRRLVAGTVGLTVVGAGLLALPSQAALAAPALAAATTTAAPAADVLDVNFNSGSSADSALNSAVKTAGAPKFEIDESLDRTVATFDGVDDGFIYNQTSAWNPALTPNITQTVTVECYFRFNGTLPTSGEQDVCSGKDSGGYTIKILGANLVTDFNIGGAYRTISVPATVGKWVHVVSTYDGSALKMYVDGELAAEMAITGSPRIPGLKTFAVGGDVAGGAAGINTFMPSTVAAVRMWSTALSAEQVAAVHTADTTPPSVRAADVLDVDFSDGGFTDHAGGVVPRLFGKPVLHNETALDRTVATFDGVEAAAIYDLPDAWNSAHSPNILNAVTVQCDFRYNGSLPVAEEQDICSGRQTGGYSIHIPAGDQPQVRGSFQFGGAKRVVSPVIEPGVWYSMVVSYDGQALKMYLDGELVDQTAVTGPGTPPTVDGWVLGGDISSKNAAASWGPVTLANSRIWSTALDSAEVAILDHQSFGFRTTDVALTSTNPAANSKLTSATRFGTEIVDQGAALGWKYSLDGTSINPGQRIGPGLTAGKHTIAITAKDVFGTPIAWSVPFTSTNIPTSGGTDTQQKDGEVTLSAIGTSPTGGTVTTTFNQATPSLATGGRQGVVPVVPTALEFPYSEGESISGRQAEDGETVTTPSSHEGIPFQRFDVTVPLADRDRRIQWSGVIDPEREVSLRVWNASDNAWREIAASRGSSTGNTVLQGEVNTTEVEGDTVRVLVLALDPFADDLAPRDASANDPQIRDSFEKDEDYDFSFVHWTDPQYIAESAVGGGTQPWATTYETLSGVQTAEEQAIYAASYRGVIDWTVDNAKSKKIAWMSNTGDVIQNNTVDPNGTDANGNLLFPGRDKQIADEFDFAADAFAPLQALGVPNQVIAGNHDVQAGNETGAESRFSKAFKAGTYYQQAQNWPEGAEYHAWDETENPDGTSTAGEDNQNNYVLFSAGGLDFVAVGLSYGVTQEEADWANSIFRRYPDRNGMLITHAYLTTSENPDGRTSPLVVDGNLLYDQVVATNPNVFLVLAGHVHGTGLNLKTIEGPEINHRVVEILADYQNYSATVSQLFTPENCPTCVVAANGEIDVDGDGVNDHAADDKLRFGASFLRMLQFNTKDATMSVDTYSPFLDEFGATEYDGEARYNGAEDNFTVPVDLTSRKTSLSTDGLAVITSGNEVIGTVTGKSGFPASITWSDLTRGQSYAWTATSSTDGVEQGSDEQFAGLFVASKAGTDKTAPVLTAPAASAVDEGAVFDALAGVSATDDADGDITNRIAVSGVVDTSSPGAYSLLYSVSDDNGNQTQALRTVTVKKAPEPDQEPTALKVSGITAAFGEPLTLKAEVDPATATGTVQFDDGEDPLCAAIVTAGRAECTVSATPAPGDHAVVATYLGDTTHARTQKSFVLKVKEPERSAVHIGAVETKAVFGGKATLRATVTPATATGTVRFAEGSTTLCTALISNGVALCAASAPKVGSHAVDAEYSGDGQFMTAQRSMVLTVAKATVTAKAVVTSKRVRVTLSAKYVPVSGQAVLTVKGKEFKAVVVKGVAQFKVSSKRLKKLAGGKAKLTATLSFKGSSSVAPLKKKVTLKLPSGGKK